MDEIKVVQDIGDMVCEGCGPNADCGIDPKDCDRIHDAIRMLNVYLDQMLSRISFD